MKKDMIMTYLKIISAILLIGSGVYGSSSDSFDIVVTVIVSVPIVSEVNPNSGINAIPTTVIIKGLYFYGGTASSNVSQIKLSNGVIFSGYSVVSNTSIESAVIPAGVAPGSYDIQVTTGKGTNTTSAQKFIVTTAEPTVTNVVPNTGPNLSPTTVSITGTGFYGGTGSNNVSTIKIDSGTNNYTFSSWSVQSDSTIINAVVPSECAGGTYDVQVTTGGGTNTTSTQKFIVITSGPTVTDVVPNTGSNLVLTTVTISGTGFYGGTGSSTVTAVKLDDSANTSLDISSASITDTTISGAVVPTEVVVGIYNVQVTAVGGTNSTSAKKFIVTGILPTVTNITPSVNEDKIVLVILPPNEYNFGNTSQTTVAITGTGFYGGTGGPDVLGIKLDDVLNTDISFAHSTITDTTISNAVISENVESGTYNVKVTTHAGTNLTSEVKFTVINKVNVHVPANSFSDVVTMMVSSYGISIPQSDTGRIKTTNVGVEITIDKNLPLQKMITITLGYKDTDVVGLDENRLAIGRYDDTRKRWIPSSTAYPELNKVVGGTTHLSIFAILQLTCAPNLENVKVYPNPFNPNRSPQFVFDNLTQNALIRIYSITGELIKEIVENDGDGRETWDGRNNSGKDVGSGIYLAVVKNSTEMKRVKIAIER